MMHGEIDRDGILVVSNERRRAALERVPWRMVVAEVVLRIDATGGLSPRSVTNIDRPVT